MLGFNQDEYLTSARGSSLRVNRLKPWPMIFMTAAAAHYFCLGRRFSGTDDGH